MFQLAFFRPTLGDSKRMEAVALRAQYIAGYEAALEAILSLSEPPVEAAKTPEQYPPLDDDSQWNNKTTR